GGPESPPAGGRSRRFLIAVVVGAVAGILVGSGLALLVQAAPTENEGRFWFGLLVGLWTFAAAGVLAIASLIWLIVRRSLRAAALLVFAITVPVTGQLVSDALWRNELAGIPHSQQGTATLDLRPAFPVNVSGPAECEIAAGQLPTGITMFAIGDIV